ncbi:conserved hypothetical protein [Gammaproteobacteria bacterium]
MDSQRFKRPIHITYHAKKRMVERCIDEELLLDIIEAGRIKYKDERHLWIFKWYSGRTDNQLCVAVLLGDDTLIVKTVMHYFTTESQR